LIIQTGTIVLSVPGGVVSAVFASGSYERHLRDDLFAAQSRSEQLDTAKDTKLLNVL